MVSKGLGVSWRPPPFMCNLRGGSFQQAPSAIFLQPGLSLAFTTASTTNQLKPPSIRRYKRYKDSNVKIELLNEEKSQHCLVQA